MKKLYNIIKVKIKRKMGNCKIEIGREYRVIPTPCGLTKSEWNCESVNRGVVYTVRVKSLRNLSRNEFNIESLTKDGICFTESTSGWAYDYELVPLVYGIDDIKNQIVNLKTDISEKECVVKQLEDKLAFMTEHGVDNFNDEEFKAYQVLKELGIDDFEKAKRITQILSNKIGC